MASLYNFTARIFTRIIKPVNPVNDSIRKTTTPD